jgi:hypothetical protein
VNPEAGPGVPGFAYYCAAQLPWLKSDAEKPAIDRVKPLGLTGKINGERRSLPLQRKPSSLILLQRGIAGPPAKPPPFLGVSSLNLAASATKRPFLIQRGSFGP